MKNLFAAALLVFTSSNVSSAEETSQNSNNVAKFTLSTMTINHPANGSPGAQLTSEAQNQQGLQQIRAHYSIAKGYTGYIYNRNTNGSLIDNVADGKLIVGTVDTGIDLDHPDLDANIQVTKSVTCRYTNGCTAGGNDTDGHGTMVAGIIGAEKNGVGMHGIVPRIKMISARAIGLSSGSDAEAIKYLASKNAKVINASYGYVDPNGSGKEYPIKKATIGDRMTPYSAATLKAGLDAREYSTSLRQAIQYAVDRHTIFVFAAGNASMDQPNVVAGLPYYFRGNLGGSAPNGYTTINPGNKDWSKNWISVVSVNSSNVLSSFSNRCGASKAWCLAAPGESIYTTYVGGGYDYGDGTSFAAPQVSGGLAALLGAFPHLAPEKVVQIMFKTATDLGAAGVDTTYGNGLLNMQKATTPTETGWQLAVASTFGANTSAFTSSGIRLAPAFGDAVTQLANREIMFLDEYDRDFVAPLSALTGNNISRMDDGYIFSQFGEDKFQVNTMLGGNTRLGFSTKADAPYDPSKPENEQGGSKLDKLSLVTTSINGDHKTESSFSYGVNPADAIGFDSMKSVENGNYEITEAFKNPYLGFADDSRSASYKNSYKGLGLKFGYHDGTLGEDKYRFADGKKVRGFVSELNLDKPNYSVSLASGVSIEEGSFLGAETGGAFTLGADTPTYFTGVAGKYKLNDNLSVMANYNLGVTKPNAIKNSLLEDVTNIYSDSFAVGATYTGIAKKDDSVTLSLSQPLRVLSGGADVKVPLDVAPNGDIFYQRESLSLSPTGREIDLESYYKVGLDEDSNLKLGSVVRFEPNHVDGAKPEGLAMVKYQLKF